MNRIMAAAAAAIILSTAITAYAHSAAICTLYPPVAFADSAAVRSGDIIVKFKIVELAEKIKEVIR